MLRSDPFRQVGKGGEEDTWDNVGMRRVERGRECSGAETTLRTEGGELGDCKVLGLMTLGKG